MNTDRNEPKQLDSQLHCRASAQLNESVLADLKSEDKSLGELLDEEKGNTTKDNQEADS